MTNQNLPQKKLSRIWQLLPPWLAVAVWAAIIYYFSAQPSLSIHGGNWDFILRKTAHFTEFAVLSLLLWRAIKKHNVSQRTALGLAAPLSVLYAFSDEFHQRFVPGRTSSLRDVGIDLAGIVAATAVATFLLSRPRPRQSG